MNIELRDELGAKRRPPFRTVGRRNEATMFPTMGSAARRVTPCKGASFYRISTAPQPVALQLLRVPFLFKPQRRWARAARQVVSSASSKLGDRSCASLWANRHGNRAAYAVRCPFWRDSIFNAEQFRFGRRT